MPQKKKSKKQHQVTIMVGGSFWDDVKNTAVGVNDYLKKSKIISKVGVPLGTALSYAPIPGVSTAGNVIKAVGTVADKVGYGKKSKKHMKGRGVGIKL